ncbi:alpha/beta fold hydrolase [Ornithinibacillus salinisoli]|uniref:Alpha/beta fold hydrolase n=1 Tax=Ornithinibacillus salinisoli TaxID=1848459 RepID=A0ABW4W0X7_9BACI
MYLTLHDIKINYNVYPSSKNNAEYLVMIHGLGLDLTTWGFLTPHLQNHFNIVLFDIRGHGKTTGNEDNITWDILVDDFNRLINHLNIERFHIVGLGFGGNLGLKIEEYYPNKVQKLILASVFMHFPESITKKEIERRKSLLTSGKMSKLAKQMIPQICVSLTPEKENLLIEAYRNINQITYYELFKMLTETVSLKDLNHIENEVLLIQGDRDPLFPIQQTSLYQNNLKQSVSYVVPNSSNLVFLDNPTTFLFLIIHFIEKGISDSFSHVIEEQFSQSLEIYYPDLSDEPLEINVLHDFTVTYKGQKIVDKWNQRKAKNLLAYLAFHKNTTREQLMNEFWYESNLTQAQNSLRVALNHLRSIFKRHNLDRFLTINREDVALTGNISCDLTNYMQKLEVCWIEKDFTQKEKFYDDLIWQSDQKLVIPLYDDWIVEVQRKIDLLFEQISEDLERN